MSDIAAIEAADDGGDEAVGPPLEGTIVIDCRTYLYIDIIEGYLHYRRPRSGDDR